MGIPTSNQPPSIFWPALPGLPQGAHVWVVGGSLAPAGVWCELVAADHVVPLVRHAVGVAGVGNQPVERLAPASVLTLGRQYQLRVRSANRTDIVGVWTVGPALPAVVVARCEVARGAIAIAVTGTALVQVDAALHVVTGAATIEVGAQRVTVRVLGADGARIDERELTIP